MGFFEDDRIRRKNLAYSEAFDLLSNMRAMGFSDNDIKKNIEFAIGFSDSDKFRIDVYHTVLKIIGGLNEEGNRG